MSRSNAMWCVVSVYLQIIASIFTSFSQTNAFNAIKQNWKGEGERDVSRRKRAFGSSAPPCNMTNGVYVEKWERIDYKRIKFLLKDPRYPNLPSYTMCVPTFEQPSNWGDFFGTRLRTYFVPFQSGNHYFFLSSNAGSELFISTNSSANGKTMISGVDGGFPTNQYEYDRFTNQKSLPVSLQKGHYYYMEAIMKDDHQQDHLEVALETPDGKFYKVIPSQFLWTTLRLSPSQNATYRAILIKTAARAGARAGSSFGARFAMKSGAKAGAKAGAVAGMDAGASAGATAGERAAIQMMKKTMEDALNLLHADDLHKFNIILQNGKVVNVTGPGMGGDGAIDPGIGSSGGAGSSAAGGAGGGGGAGGTAGAGGTGGAAGTAGTAGTAGGAGGGGGGGGGGVGGSTTGAAGTGEGGAASMGRGAGGSVGGGAGTGTGTGAGLGLGVGQGGVTVVGGGASTSGGTAAAGGSAAAGAGAASTVGGGTGIIPLSGGFTAERDITFIPQPGQDPQAVARALVWKVGGASKLVDQGLYTVHSYDIPYQQENGTLNFCWQSHNGELALWQFCQVFKIHIPGLYKRAAKKERTVSFESVCLPGFFVRQKNYHLIVQRRDGTELFDKDSSFTAYSVMKFTRNLLLQSMHKDWYICQTKLKSIHRRVDIRLDFYNGEPDVLNRCTFLFHPIAQTENKYRMCRNVVGPVKHPSIAGQPLPHPPHLVPKTPSAPFLSSCIPVCSAGKAGGTVGGGTTPTVAPSVPMTPEPSVKPREKQACVALNFVNNFGLPFKVFSSLKHEGYLVNGSGFKLKLLIDRPELHSHVTFYAEDPSRKNKILLNGQSNISVPVVPGCSEFVTASITSGPGTSAELPPSVTSGASVSPGLSPPGAPSKQTEMGVSSPQSPQSYAPSTAPSAVPSAAPSAAPSPVTPSSSTAAPQAPASNETISHGAHPAVHYHYHFHGKKTSRTDSACPVVCAESVECHPSCPPPCCQRQPDEV